MRGAKEFIKAPSPTLTKYLLVYTILFGLLAEHCRINRPSRRVCVDSVRKRIKRQYTYASA